MTSSNGNFFRVTGPLCGNSPVTGEFPSQRPVKRSFDVSFDLRLNIRKSYQLWVWWFETPRRSLIRPCNAILGFGSWYIFLENTLHDWVMLDDMKNSTLTPIKQHSQQVLYYFTSIYKQTICVNCHYSHHILQSISSINMIIFTAQSYNQLCCEILYTHHKYLVL